MSKLTELADKMAEAIVEIDFVPSTEMIAMKHILLARLEDNPLYAMADITPELAIRIARDKRIASWAKQPGFMDWLQNKSEYRERLTASLAKAMERADKILDSEDPKAYTAQVNILKLYIEAANKMPQKYKEKVYADASVQHLNPAQIDEFMKKAGYVKLNSIPAPELPETIEMEEESSDE